MAKTKPEKVWYRRWWAIVLFAIIAWTVLSSITGNNTSASNSDSGTSILGQAHASARRFFSAH